MTDTIIVALLSLVGTFLSGLAGIRLVSYRIEQLEKKVDKHNNVVERMYSVEGRIRECEHDICDIRKRPE